MTDQKNWALRLWTGATPRLGVPDAATLVVGLFDALHAWHEHTRARRELLSLSDHVLKDIGISRATAEQAADAPFRTDAPFRR